MENMAMSYALLIAIDHSAHEKSTWLRLKAFDGATEATKRLRTKYTMVVLTILSWESIVSSSKTAEIQWEGILSCW